MSLIDILRNSQVVQQRNAQAQQQMSEPWQKLTEEDVANLNTGNGQFNNGYTNPYPGKTIWSGANLGNGADPNSFYAGSLDPSFFKVNAGSNNASGGFMGDISRGITEM